MDIKPLNLTRRADSKKIEIFLKCSNFEKLYEENLSLGLQRLMPSLWKRLLDEKQECSLYFVGAKNGLLEVPLLKNLIKYRRSIKAFYLTYQGISSAMREEFSQRVKENGFSKLSPIYQVIPFEDPLYIEPRVHIALNPYEWFDMVSWKNTPREHNTLVKFKNSIHDNGVGLLIFPYRADDRFLLSQKLNFLSSMIAGEEVVEELIHLEVRHQAYIVETIVDTESCFEHGCFHPSKTGEQLLSYVLQVEWPSLPEQTKKNIGMKISEFAAHYNKQKMILQHLFLWIFPGTPRKRDAKTALPLV